MSEFSPPKSEKEFDLNFSQIKPLMNSTEAFYESSRCLFCFDAPCVNACPTGIDIPLFIRQINSGNSIGSAKTIYDSNWLGNACGKVCPTEVLCEGACVYNHQNVKPIEIGRLQNFATNQAIDQNKKLYEKKPFNGKKVAVIGAGPAGISCACELCLHGFKVDIYEAKSRPSGLTVYGVAPYKITDQDALKEMKYLQEQFDFTIKYNSPVCTKKDLANLETQYDVIFIGIGLGSTSVLKIKGENLKNCIGAVEFIEELRTKRHKVKAGKKVVVLGGGNTAMDAASESCRMGAETVTLTYRRSKEEMGAYEFEYDLAKSVGAKGLFNVSPVEIIGNGKVEGIKFIKTESKNGKLKEIKGSEFVVECDMVIKSTGQSKQLQLLNLIDELKLDEKGKIKVNPKNYQTSNPKYFAGGDAVNGGAEVVNGAYEGKKAALGIIKILIKQ